MNHEAPQKPIYISQTYRWMENAHIFLWLIKDLCWALEFKTGGVFMVIPTVTVAFYITWKSRRVRSELCHNIAVCFWILANSSWMIGEFTEHEARPYAALLFGAGLSILLMYYIFYFPKDRRAEKAYTLRTSSPTSAQQ
jgi:4-hydroxybenzoate polyprenyltransferase